MTTRVPHLSKSVSVTFFPLKIQITSWNKQANHLQLVSPSLFLFAQWSLHCFRSTYQVAITYQGPLAAAQGRCFHCQTPVYCRTTIASRTYPLWISKYEWECCVSYQVLHCNHLHHVRKSGFRNPGNFCLWNLKSRALESGIQLKGSRIPLTIGI